MNTNHISNVTGWVSIVAGVTGLLGLVFIILFFGAGQPFGSLNDICIGLAGILSAVLAGLLFAEQRSRAAIPGFAGLIVAIAGALVVALGSLLVLSGARVYFLAGLYMAAGNGLIGVWIPGAFPGLVPLAGPGPISQIIETGSLP